MRKLKTLELEESAADILVVDRIKFATLDLTKELIKGIISTLASLKVIGGLRSRSIVVGYWTISWVLACLQGGG